MIHAFILLVEAGSALPAKENAAAFAALVIDIPLLFLICKALRTGLEPLLFHLFLVLQAAPLLTRVVGVGLAAAETLPTAADVAAQLHRLLGFPFIKEELAVFAADVFVGALLHVQTDPHVAQSLELFLSQQRLHIVHVDRTRALLLGTLKQHCAGTVPEGANVFGKTEPAKGAFAVDESVGTFHQIPAQGATALILVGNFVDFVFDQIQGFNVSRNFDFPVLEYNLEA
jgi:hypothetical protein